MTDCPTPFLAIEVAAFQRDVEAYFAGTRDRLPVIQLAGFAVDG